MESSSSTPIPANTKDSEHPLAHFARSIEAARKRTAVLRRHGQSSEATLEEAFEELQTTLEELSVAEEEIRQQHEEILATNQVAEAERQRYQDLFEFAPDGYIVSDQQGAIQEINRAAAELLGATQHSLLSKPLSVFIPVQERRAFRSQLLRLAREERVTDWLVNLCPRNRDPIPVALTVATMRDTEDRPVQLRWQLRDVTAIKQTERQLQEQIERTHEYSAALEQEQEALEQRVQERTAELGAANSVKDELIQREHISQEKIYALNEHLQRAMIETHHRVKNNLQVIAALIDILVMDGRETLSIAEVERLGLHIRTLATIHDLLTNQAKVDPAARFISAKAVLERLLNTTQATIGKSALRFRIEEAQLETSQCTSLALVVNELISNALKHGHDGVEVTFSVRGERGWLQVSNTGPGFPEGFDPAQTAGTGLELVENLTRHDLRGETYYDNPAEGGARVTVSFPLPAR